MLRARAPSFYLTHAPPLFFFFSGVPASAQSACSAITCQCSTPHCNSSQPYSPEACPGNGELFNSMVAPFVNMTVFGHIWYQ